MLLALAPMQDLTDLAFMRTLARLQSLPDYFVTPYFRSTPTTCAFTEVNLRCITENPTTLPIWAQIAGSDPAAIVRDIAMLQRYPIAGIDLNAGCPSSLVNRNNAGAGLLRDTPLFSRVLRAMRDSLPQGQFSVKCRTGWADESELPHLLELIAEAQPDRLTLHGRTRKQVYSGRASRAAMQLAAQVMHPCPLIANGDIESVADAQQCLAQVKAAGIMIGRGAVKNPFIFRELRGGAAATADEMRHYYQILMEETGRVLIRPSEKGHCNRMKKYLAYIYPHLGAQREYALRRCTSLREMEQLLLSP